MSIVDVLIVIFIIVGGMVGFKQGFTKSILNFLGIILIIVLSFLLKNYVSNIFMNIFPFIPFSGYIKGVTVLNILLYELLAFAFVFFTLMIIFKVLLRTSSLFEKALNFTIVFGIPSKLLGMLVGLFKNYIIVFFVMYFLALPNFYEVSVVKDSKLKEPILKYTPALSSIADNTLNVVNEFNSIADKYKTIDDSNEFNLETLDIFLKYDVTTVAAVDNLVKNGKIKIENIDTILNKYR